MLLQTPNYEPTNYKNFEVERPCYGGINLYNIEYEQSTEQSPDVLNMMYRNGVFGKRYGIDLFHKYGSNINGMSEYNGSMILHIGTGIYKPDQTLIASGIPNASGHFFYFNRFLFYLCNGKYYQYSDDGGGLVWKEVTPYVPDVIINRSPDGSSPGDSVDDLNRVGNKFNVTFHSDGVATTYILPDNFKPYDNTKPRIFFNGELMDASTYTFFPGEGGTNARVVFTTAPAEQINGLCVECVKTDIAYQETILTCTMSIAYGGNNNSRIFLGGNGSPTIYWSDVYDATYFPESNYARIGSTNEDIQGFGEQYDTLMVFKPQEIYSVQYYTDADGIGRFQTKLVNSDIGCDAPKTIKLINNLLVWVSTKRGVCTLVSTNLEDERNVRVISRNIDGGHRILGLLEEPNLENSVAADFDFKYLLTVNGKVYCWDYYISPYYNSSKLETDATRLSWFIFDGFNVKDYLVFNKELYFSSGTSVCKLTNDYMDVELARSTDSNKVYKPISAHYKTPMYQFGAVEYLKTVKNVYVQTRGDTASVIEMKYLTEENPRGEAELEPIIIGRWLWDEFSWNDFGWTRVVFGATHRRKCNLKKIQMCGILFENSQLGRDLSLSHITFQYAILKYIK